MASPASWMLRGKVLFPITEGQRQGSGGAGRQELLPPPRLLSGVSTGLWAAERCMFAVPWSLGVSQRCGRGGQVQRHAGPKPSSWLRGWLTCAHNCSVTPPDRAWPAGAVLSDWVLGFQKRGMGEAGWPPPAPRRPPSQVRRLQGRGAAAGRGHSCLRPVQDVVLSKQLRGESPLRL